MSNDLEGDFSGPKCRRKRGIIVAEAKLSPGCKNGFGKLQKHFLLSRRRFCVFNICCVRTRTRKHLGNAEETLNVSRLFHSGQLNFGP